MPLTLPAALQVNTDRRVPSPNAPDAPHHKPAILLLIDTLDIGGAERHVIDLGIALHTRGHNVRVACTGSGILESELQRAGIPITRLLSNQARRRFSPILSWRLRRFVKDSRIDLVHAHLYSASIAAALATLGTRIPLVVTEHSEGTWRGLRQRSMTQIVRRRSSHLIAISAPIARSISADQTERNARVSVIPGAVKSSPNDAGVPRIDRRSTATVTVGVIARLEYEKGVDIFIRAVPSILKSCPDARFVIVGDGSLRLQLQQDAVRLGVHQRVFFAGRQPDARSLLSGVHILTVPSRSEGSPLVILEAMRARVPVVAARVGGIPGQIRDGVDGILVPAEDPPALAGGIIRLINDPVERWRLAAAAHQHCVHTFDHEAMVDAIEDVYLSVLPPSRARRGLRPSTRGGKTVTTWYAYLCDTPHWYTIVAKRLARRRKYEDGYS